MGQPQGAPRYTLQRTAAIVFGLVAILPLLLFAYTLYTLGALGRPQAQLMLALALGAVLIGLYIFRGLTLRMAAILRAAAAPAQPEASPQAPAEEPGLHLPGFGTITGAEPEAIRESDMLLGAVEGLRAVWRTEAEPYLGQRVLVSVRNSPEPVAGTLSQITDDGLLLLDADGKRVGVSYRRISAVEPDRRP